MLNKHQLPPRDPDLTLVPIQRGTPLGNPLGMRGEAERGLVIEGFAEILEDGRPPLEVARDYTPPLRIHQGTARVTREQRKEMLGRVLALMLRGRRVGLVCACAPLACHGDVIAAKLVRMYCDIASP